MNDFAEHNADPCFYCDREIGNEPRVKGDKADAHKRCVDARLDKINPRWRDIAAEATP